MNAGILQNITIAPLKNPTSMQEAIVSSIAAGTHKGKPSKALRRKQKKICAQAKLDDSERSKAPVMIAIVMAKADTP